MARPNADRIVRYRDPLLALREQILERVAEVVERGVYILGPEVKAFEQEFAAYLGVRHVIGVANGTDAITIALKALGVGRDDEVVVPSFTFYASAEAIVTRGHGRSSATSTRPTATSPPIRCGQCSRRGRRRSSR